MGRTLGYIKYCQSLSLSHSPQVNQVTRKAPEAIPYLLLPATDFLYPYQGKYPYLSRKLLKC